MTRVALYARVSTKEQSTEAQVGQLTAYCQARGWAEVAVFRDDGISGVRDNRPELDRLRERIASGEFDTIVVSKMDRLGRSLGMILRFWDDAEAAGARVIVIDQGIDTSTPSGRLQRNMLAALAEFERELILERTQAGIARARALGKKFGRSTEDPRVRGEGGRGPQSPRREPAPDLDADERQARSGAVGPVSRPRLVREACISGRRMWRGAARFLPILLGPNRELIRTRNWSPPALRAAPVDHRFRTTAPDRPFHLTENPRAGSTEAVRSHRRSTPSTRSQLREGLANLPADLGERLPAEGEASCADESQGLQKLPGLRRGYAVRSGHLSHHQCGPGRDRQLPGRDLSSWRLSGEFGRRE